MNGEKLLSSFEEGKVISGSGCGKVIETKNKNFRVGDIITSHIDLCWEWKEFLVFNEEQLNNYFKINNIPESFVSHSIGQLGMPGLSAYFGMLDRGQPKEGETLVVSGGAGACGSIAGQIGKLKGCKVIGIASSAKKVDHMMKCLGYDQAVSYEGKTEEVIFNELKNLAPNGVDIYFDNVGGFISNAVLRLMNKNGRVPICGQISQYNKDSADPLPPAVSQHLKDNNVDRRWFMVYDYREKFNEGWEQLLNWAKNGQLRLHQTEYEGIDSAPKAFVDLFQGKNIGKLIIKIET